jgi:chromosome segregation ATPase
MSILALMISAVATRLRPQSTDVEITKLKAQIDELERKLESVRRDRDGWMDIAQRWRARYETMQPNEEIARAQLQAQQLMAMAQQAQQSPYYNQGAVQQIGSQLAGAYEGFCNCVPARHDAFMGTVKRST